MYILTIPDLVVIIIVNAVCLYILGGHHEHGHGHPDFPDWVCKCGIPATVNPYSFDQAAMDRETGEMLQLEAVSDLSSAAAGELIAGLKTGITVADPAQRNREIENWLQFCKELAVGK